jgi:hypothetical protein
MNAEKATQQSAKRTTGKASKGFTAEEKAAMKARARELKADKADGESAVRASIAAMSPQDRAIAKRLHEVIKATAPDLSPKTWYEPRRGLHVAGRLRAGEVDRSRRGQDPRAREESGELRTELATGHRPRRDRRSGRGVPA